MTDCTHDCSTCSQNCSERDKQSLIKPLHEGARVNKVIGVVSGKGGVGKSLVTSLLAVAMQQKGYKCAVLDADITGPSIPQAFGIHDKAMGDGTVIFPVETKTGIQLMSINLLLEDETDPVVWRGPVIGGAVQQFWTDVAWNDVDFMFVYISAAFKNAGNPIGKTENCQYFIPGTGTHGFRGGQNIFCGDATVLPTHIRHDFDGHSEEPCGSIKNMSTQYDHILSAAPVILFTPHITCQHSADGTIFNEGFHLSENRGEPCRMGDLDMTPFLL